MEKKGSVITDAITNPIVNAVIEARPHQNHLSRGSTGFV
jgi:hypothetical protein